MSDEPNELALAQARIVDLETQNERQQQQLLHYAVDVCPEQDRRIAELEAALNFNERAAKLSLKRKPFIVVANDEPYFVRVYAMIRSFEWMEGRWNDADEQAFRAALDPNRR